MNAATDSERASGRRARLRWLLGVVLTGAIATAVLVPFYGGFAYLPDDGAYAYVASRMLAGDVLHRDVQDVHAGYINFVNAASMRVFGESFGSMRLPLVFLTIAQAILTFVLIARRHAGLAVAAGLTMAALTFVQFLNPTANWYCLFFVVLTVFAADRCASGTTVRLLMLGALVGIVFLFRQLSGVIVGVATVFFVLSSEPSRYETSRNLPVRAFLAAVLAITLVYAWTKASIVSFVLFSAAPLIVGANIVQHCRIGTARAAYCLGMLAAGALIATAPLVIYHIAHGSVTAWINDSFVDAIALSNAGFIRDVDFQWLLLASLINLVKLETFATTVNGAFWALLVLCPLILGLTIISARRSGVLGDRPQPLVVFAAFYCLVSLHYHIPIYLFYSAALTLLAIISITSCVSRRAQWAGAALALFLSATGLAYHAAEPLSRNYAGLIRGDPAAAQMHCDIPRLDIRTTTNDCRTYGSLLAIISEHAGTSDTILALPVNPELYFLSGRKSPLPFYSSALGLRDSTDVAEALAMVTATPPAVLIYNPTDKYNSPETADLARIMLRDYRQIATIGKFDVFVPKDNG